MQSAGSIIKDNYEATIDSLEEKINLLTKLLSALCEHVEKSPQALILVTIADGKVARWWGKHKKAEIEHKAREAEVEARKIAFEQKKREREVTREKILKKLTPDEIKILGIS